ncbi:hypothetical protein V8B97DRAFT_2011169 [Scleroderma yunnanense]
MLVLTVFVEGLPRYGIHCHRKAELASVSRRWRDIILNIPVLWTTLKFLPSSPRAFVKLHVVAILWILKSTIKDARRNVVYFGSSLPLLVDNNHPFLFKFILPKMQGIPFPSLVRAVVRGNDMHYPRGLHRPALGHLKIQMHYSINAITVPVNVSSLTMEIHSCLLFPVPSLLFLSSDTSTSLTLTGFTILSICHVSNHLTLAFTVLRAIIAPGLSRLSYEPGPSDEPTSNAFGQIGFKFANLGHFSFCATDIPLSSDGANVGDALCAALPGVRDAILRLSDIPLFFEPNDDGHCAADEWSHLEHLTFTWHQSVTPDIVGDFVKWLTRRALVGKPKLHVKLTSLPAKRGSLLDSSFIPIVHEQLREHCFVKYEPFVMPLNFDPMVRLPRPV